MAKQYAFRLSAQRAEFSRGFVSVIYGVDCTLAEKTIVGTLGEGLAQLADFSAENASKPHVAFLAMQYRNDRKPAGFDKACKSIRCDGLGGA